MAIGGKDELDLRAAVRVVRQRAWLIVLIVAVAAGLGYGLAKRQANQYEAVAEVRITNPNASNVFSSNGQVNVDPKRLVDTETKVVQSNDIKTAVDQRLGPDAVLAGAVTVTNPTGTDLLDITVRSTSPQVARDAANAYADVYVESRVDQRVKDLNDRTNELRKKADDLAAQIATLDPADPTRAGLQTTQSNFANLATQNEAEAALLKGNVQVVDEAQLPDAPVAPKPYRDALLAAVLALLVGLGLVFLLDRLDDRVKGPETFADDGFGGVPVLGTLPIYAPNRKRGTARVPDGPPRLVALGSIDAEVYRTIRSNVRFSVMGREKNVLMVTSSTGGEGKSTVTANLAVALAHDGFRVIVLSADLRRPSIGEAFGVSETDIPGLSDALTGQEIKSVPVKTESNELFDFVPSGALPPNPAELLGSNRMRELIDQLRASDADYVLIDCPPVLPVSDPLGVAQFVDGVIVLAMAERTKEAEVRETVERLRKVDANIIGVIVNGMSTTKRSSDYRYYQRYGVSATT